MAYITPEGGAILYPDISDRALLNITPTTFFRKVIQKNPEMTCNMMTTENIKLVFMDTLSSRCLQDSSFPEIRTQQVGMVQRWEESSDWNLLRQILYAKPVGTQTVDTYGARGPRQIEVSLPLDSSRPRDTKSTRTFAKDSRTKQTGPSTPKSRAENASAAEMAYAIKHIPCPKPMSDVLRRTLIAAQSSLHVILPEDYSVLRPGITHLHFSRNSIQGTANSRKLDLVLSYNRAIVIEYGDKEQLMLGAKQISSQKFSYDTILRPRVERFADRDSMQDTQWYFFRRKGDHSHSVHEALRRFFCLQGSVPAIDILPGGMKVRVRYHSSPVWLQKLAVNDRKVSFVEVRDSKNCNLCKSTAEHRKEDTTGASAVWPASAGSPENSRLHGPEHVKRPSQIHIRRGESLQPTTQSFSHLPDSTRHAPKRKLSAASEAFPVPLLRYEGPELPASEREVQEEPSRQEDKAVPVKKQRVSAADFMGLDTEDRMDSDGPNGPGTKTEDIHEALLSLIDSFK